MITWLAGKEKVLRLTMGSISMSFSETCTTAWKMLGMHIISIYPFVVYLVIKKKGYENRLKALPALSRTARYRFAHRGDGVRGEQLVKMAQKLGVHVSVELGPSDENLPQVPDVTLPLYYSAMLSWSCLR